MAPGGVLQEGEMKRAKIGDVIEIRTAKGYAYAIYTHHHKLMGALLRVFNTVYASRPENITGVVEDSVRLVVFFPLQSALNRSIVKTVGNVPIAESLRVFPLFRNPGVPNLDGKADKWWLWDGERSTPIEKLTQEQRRLPVRGIWNDTLLVERIDNGWRHEDDRQ
jgi:hypothetical protein